MHVCMDTMNRFSFQISQIFCSRLTNQFKPNLIKCQISARFCSLFQRMSCLDTIRGHWSRWSTLIIKWFPLTAGEITSHFKIKPLITFLIWSFSCILCACERSQRLSSTPICASWDSLVTKVFFSVMPWMQLSFYSVLKLCNDFPFVLSTTTTTTQRRLLYFWERVLFQNEISDFLITDMKLFTVVSIYRMPSIWYKVGSFPFGMKHLRLLLWLTWAENV